MGLVAATFRNFLTSISLHQIPTCPTCSHEIEDGDYFLRCTECPEWKSDMFCALQNYFSNIPTRPFLGDLLITDLSKWLRNELAIVSDFPPIYNSLIFHQTRIGWKQLFVGRFVFEWSDLQQDYLVLQSIVSEKYSGTSRITGVILIIWNHVYHNWEARNVDLHGGITATRESAQYVQAQKETEEIHSQHSLVQPRDRDVFYSNTNEHFQKEPTGKGSTPGNHFFSEASRTASQRVLTALIPSMISPPPPPPPPPPPLPAA